MEGFGREVEKAGDMLAQNALAYQKINNESLAKDSVVNYAQGEGDLITGMYTLEGRNAKAALPKFQQDIQALRQKSLENLNPAARRIADQEITRRAGYALIDAGRHAAQQDKVAIKASGEAKIKLDRQDITSNPYNEKLFQQKLADIRTNYAGLGHLEGADKDVVDAKLNEEITGAYADRVKAIAIGRRDPFGGKAYYESVKDNIKDQSVRNDLERMLIQQYNTYGSSIRADEITEGQTYEGKLKRAESRGNPFARSRTSSAGGWFQFTDDTWKDLRARHPELNLTPEGRFDREEATLGLRALTQDNRDALEKAGIDPNDKNARMAHFLGATGATKFIKALQTNPDILAISAGVTPSQVKANHSVFYDETGRPRTAQEVYNNQTAGFGGPEGKLTGKTGADWLEHALQTGREVAEKDAPGDVQYAKQLEDKIYAAWNREHTRQRSLDNANFSDVYSFVMGRGDYNQRITRPEDVEGHPDVAGKLSLLPSLMQERIRKQILANSKPDVTMNVERTRTFQAAMGMAITDPEGFQALDSTTLDLPFAQQNEIFKKQQAIIQKNMKAGETSQINGVLGNAVIKSMLQSVGFPPAKDDVGRNQQYNQFIGGLDEKLNEYKRFNNNKPMPFEEQKKVIGNMIADSIENSSWFTTRKNFEVPNSFKSEWGAKAKELNGGRDLSDVQWGGLYRKYLSGLRAKAHTYGAE